MGVEVEGEGDVRFCTRDGCRLRGGFVSIRFGWSRVKVDEEATLFDCAGGGGKVGSDALNLSNPDSGEGADFGGSGPLVGKVVELIPDDRDEEDEDEASVDDGGGGSGMRGCGIDTDGIDTRCCGVRERTGVSPPIREVEEPTS